MNVRTTLGFGLFLSLMFLLTGSAQAMNKAELIEAIATDAGLSKPHATRALEAFEDATAEALKKGDRVSLVGFGSFSISRRMAPGSCEVQGFAEFEYDPEGSTCASDECRECTTDDEMLANRIAEYSKLPPDVASAVLEIIKKEIVAELFESNRDVTIRGFGSWSIYVEAKTSRKGRNPQTGKEINIPAKKVVKFKAGAELAGKVK